MFEVGDTVVSPQHGAGRIELRETKVVLGEAREYLLVRILHSDMTRMVPAEAAEEGALRPVMDDAMLARLVEVLHGGTSASDEAFNRRFRHNRDRLKSGDPLEVGRVVRDLWLRKQEKRVSLGERQMLQQARRQLASELRYALRCDEAAAMEWLDDVLDDGAGSLGSRSARRDPPTRQ